MNVLKFNPLRASSYLKLPSSISRKNAIINVENNDERCFGYAIMSAISKPKGESFFNSACKYLYYFVIDKGLPQRVSSYGDMMKMLNWEGINFPVKLKDIPTFEKNNKISVNVYGIETAFEDGKTNVEIVGPLYYSYNKKQIHVNLLLLEKNGKSHYLLDKKFFETIKSAIVYEYSEKILLRWLLAVFLQ